MQRQLPVREKKAGRRMEHLTVFLLRRGNAAAVRQRPGKGLLAGLRTMTSNIVIEMGYAADLHRQELIATGVVLFVFILLINLSFSALKRRADA